MHKTMQQKAAEAHNMCKLKGDSMLDNSDRQIAFEAVYDSEEQAQPAVECVTEEAKAVETEACVIQHHISRVEDGFLMQMQIEFSCQAEVVLFQMAVR